MMKYAKAIKLCLLIGFILFCSRSLLANGSDELSMVIVIPSYNNEKWCVKNLESVLHQHYSNYRIIYVNDCSKDRTGNMVEQCVKEMDMDYRVIDFNPPDSDIETIVEAFCTDIQRERHFFTLVNNKKRVGALANLYRMIHSCDDEEIIVTLDGDDWLANDEVLHILNTTYQSGNIWFTHGTLKEYPWGHVAWCEPIPESVIKNNAIRSFKCPSHLRTFYAWLFKKILLEDFLYKGDFFPMAWDMAIMYPLAEMAEERHAFIKKILYIYNMANPINDNRVNAQLQNDLDAWIRKKMRYQRLPDIEKEL